jgi:protein tyrosine phosphatase
MSYLNLTESFKEYKQLSFSKMTDLFKQNMIKYEHERSEFFRGLAERWVNVAEMNEVHDGIFVGNVNSALNVIELRKIGITKILNMAEDEEYDDYRDVDDIDVVKIGIYDGHMTPVGVYHTAAEMIDTAILAGEKILVHCSAGISRSSTAVISYLMLRKGYSFSQSLLQLQEKRTCISPHPLLVRSIIRDFEEKFIW